MWRTIEYGPYVLEITSVAVDVRLHSGPYLVTKVSLREAMLAIHHDRKRYTS